MTRFALQVAYDGTDFLGWQVQSNGPTIQGELQRAIATLIGKTPDGVDLPAGRVLGSGRTDSGVHSIGQIASVDLPRWPASTDALLRAINSKLPPTIRVTRVWQARADFHPIADCVEKTYRYRLQVSGQVDPFDHRTLCRSVDVDPVRLQLAAAVFVGTHDFAAMQAAGAPRRSTVRTITQSHWFCQPAAEHQTADSMAKEVWIYEVTANGFLYNMVRNLVGTMIEVGRGRREVPWIDAVLAGRDRSAAGPTAAAGGLCMHRVRYPEGSFG